MDKILSYFHITDIFTTYLNQINPKVTFLSPSLSFKLSVSNRFPNENSVRSSYVFNRAKYPANRNHFHFTTIIFLDGLFTSRSASFSNNLHLQIISALLVAV